MRKEEHENEQHRYNDGNNVNISYGIAFGIISWLLIRVVLTLIDLAGRKKKGTVEPAKDNEEMADVMVEELKAINPEIVIRRSKLSPIIGTHLECKCCA